MKLPRNCQPYLFACLLIVPGLTACGSSSDQTVQEEIVAPLPSMSRQELDSWVEFYYEQPRPEMALSALGTLGTSGLLKSELRDPFTVFFSEVFKSEPEKVAGWLDAIGENRPELLDFALKSIWFSNSFTIRYHLISAKERFTTFRQPITWMLENEPEALDNIEMSRTGAMDMRWYAFYATGATKHVKPIIDALGWIEHTGSAEQLTAAGAARWSLEQHAAKHKRVMEILQKAKRRRSGKVAEILGEVVQAAQTAGGAAQGGGEVLQPR